MRTEDKWDDAVREKLTGIEKNLPEGDWSEFLAKSKAGKKSTGKVLAIILGCCVAAAAIASVLMLPRHATNPEYNGSDLAPSLLAENTVRKPESSGSIINEGETTSGKPPKQYPKEYISEETSTVGIISKTSGAETLNETCMATNEGTKAGDISRQDCNEATSEEPFSHHASESNAVSLEQEDDYDRNRTGGHSVSISLLGTGGKGSSSDRIAPGGGTNNGINESSDFYEYSHRRPTSFGMTISYGLTSKLSIVTGLEYSRYRSSITYTKENLSANQRADYLGIPIRIDYQALRSNHFAVYTGAGFKADWCVKASYAGEKLTDKSLNWTVYATAGAQYEILRGISIYIEPEISYYLNNSDQTLRTYRTENPLMISAVLGVRLSFGNQR